MPTAAAALGNAVLSFASGFVAAEAGGANPLAGRAFVLLRDSFDSVLAKGGFRFRRELRRIGRWSWRVHNERRMVRRRRRRRRLMARPLLGSGSESMLRL